MPSRRTLTFLLAACLLAIVAADARALNPPTRTPFPYRFLPGRSVLNKSGGFAGVDEDYHVRGTFDLKLTPSPLAVSPPVYNAKFINVDAWATHPIRDETIDLDDALNLSGLSGGQRLTPGRDLYQFLGKTDDGSSVELFAKTVGPWFYLRGGTTPPAGSADFFAYHIRALAHLRPSADFNDDEVVDGADVQVWAANEGRAGGDFLEWQRQLGETPPSQTSLDAALDVAIASAGAATSIPEPASAALVLAGGAAIASLRRRAFLRRRRPA